MKCSSGGVIAGRRAGRLQVRLLALLAAALLLLLVGARPAHAAFGFASFQNAVQQSDGSEADQAGMHPYGATVSFTMNATTDPLFGEVPDGLLKDMVVDLPAGFVGDPTATATCTQLQLTPALPLCPVDSQVGIVVVAFRGLGSNTQAYPVFNMVPEPGQVARFAFNPQGGTPISIVASVRSDSDYGVRATLPNISEASPFIASRLELWGVPGDPSHDAQRGDNFICFDDPATDPGSCTGGGVSTSLPAKAFLTNPTYCGGPLTTNVSADSWTGGSDRTSYTTASGITGCDRLRFEPAISVIPDSTQTDAPTGLSVDLSVPQNDNPNGFATPSLRKAVVTLPDGVSLNAPEADGLTGCTDAQIGLHSTAPVACPDGSKIGDIRIDTPLLAEPLTGAIFLGQPVPGKQFRIFLDAESAARGISIRLEGVLSLDSQTGQVTTTFDNEPQLPFSSLHLHFKGGPRAPLATPTTCGLKTASAQLTPWADPNAAPVTVTSSFSVSADGHGAPCPPPGFAPGFQAGLTSPAAGRHSSFTLTLTRRDGEQLLKSIDVTMPKGLLADIADVPVLCGAAQAAAGTCSEGSRIGSVTTGVGAGALPFFLPGRVYVTGPYKGAPFGLSIVVPAVAGPFDLGTVVVRAAINLDPATAQLRIVSDPLPTIVGGVPLRLRTVNVHIDRLRFMLAPTNCTASRVLGTIGSTLGAVSRVSDRFQVANCANLPFAPQMSLAVGARHHTRAGVSTPLTTTVRMTPGQANLRSVSVLLPATLNALLPVLNRACTLAQFEAGHCSRAARVGSAVAVTPLLRDPLRGSVYFVKNPARTLPDLMVALRGQVAVNLTGKVSIGRGNRLATKFDTIPDVAITKFALRLVSGANGPLGATTSLCSAKARRALVQLGFRAQNGKVVQRSQRMRILGCPKARRAGHGG